MFFRYVNFLSNFSIFFFLTGQRDTVIFKSKEEIQLFRYKTLFISSFFVVWGKLTLCLVLIIFVN